MNKLNNINSKQDHILACLSSAPSNAKIIRSAARMAKAFDSQFTAYSLKHRILQWLPTKTKSDWRKTASWLNSLERLSKRYMATIFRTKSQSLPASPVLLELFWAKAPLSKSICLENRH